MSLQDALIAAKQSPHKDPLHSYKTKTAASKRLRRSITGFFIFCRRAARQANLPHHPSRSHRSNLSFHQGPRPTVQP